MQKDQKKKRKRD